MRNPNTSAAQPQPGPPVSVVLPVKNLATAKSRLAPAAGERRGSLALAFAADTLRAVLSCPVVGLVVVVTDDARVADRLGGGRVVIVPEGHRRGLNPAVQRGASEARMRAPESPVAAMSADLPALQPAELARALAAARAWPRAFVPDSTGEGTTVLVAAPGVDLDPRFGGRSAAAHEASGAERVVPDGIDSVRRDVDTGADLAIAVRLGVGPHTHSVLSGEPPLPLAATS